MRKISTFLACLLVAFGAGSCSAVAGIFKAGMGFGVFIVIFVIVVILVFVLRGNKK